jgi:hypothetical protein
VLGNHPTSATMGTTYKALNPERNLKDAKAYDIERNNFKSSVCLTGGTFTGNDAPAFRTKSTMQAGFPEHLNPKTLQADMTFRKKLKANHFSIG